MRSVTTNSRSITLILSTAQNTCKSTFSYLAVDAVDDVRVLKGLAFSTFLSVPACLEGTYSPILVD
ncbi:MAG: hypothetical protein QOI57_3004 [Rubrobacteraceae bacterium]|nr:hypothetical protein [Rubrobacteraceae bacterium]